MEIKKLTISDLPILNKIRSESKEFLHDKNDYSLDDTINWFKKLKDPYFIVIHNNEKIGYFRTSNWKENSLYLGMDIGLEYRGNGYAIPAYKKMIIKLKEEYKISIIYLEVLETNLRAQHIYKKLGFKKIEILPYNSVETSIKMKLEL